MFLISIQPWLKNHIGHFYSYHMSVMKACDLLNWKYVSLIPKDCKIKNLPDSWIRILTNDFMSEKKTAMHKIFNPPKNFFPLYKYIKKIRNDDKTIIFLEQFGIVELFIVTMLFIIQRPKTSFLLLHRFSKEDYGRKKYVYKFLNYILQKIFKKNLFLITDSDLIAKSLEPFFNQKVHVVPIPHTSSIKSWNDQIKNPNTLWWPGGSTRPDKGLKHVNDLSKILSKKKSKYRIIIAKSAFDKLEDHANIEFIQSNLSNEKYQSYMQTSGIIFLPYLPEDYSKRTSGIFVEAIASGAMPVVFDKTWMAYELKKHDLFELIIDINKEDLLEYFDFIQEDQKVKEKLRKMQNYYLNFHTEENYAKVLKNIVG